MFRRLFILLLAITFALPLYSQTGDQEKRKREIEEEIAQLDKQLSLNKSRQQSGIKELNFIKRKIANRKRLLAELETEIKKIDEQISRKEQDVSKLEGDYNYLKRQYAKFIYTAFKNRDQKIWFSYILASENLSQGYRRWAYFRDYAGAVKEKAQYIKGKEEQLRNERDQLDKIKSKSLKTKESRTKETSKLESEQKNAQNIINQLSSKDKEFRTQLASKRKEVERLNREIERILAAAVKDKEKPAYRESPEDKMISGKFENNKGRLPWPVKRGEITEGFGQHNHPVFKNVKMPFNNGINIATDPGADVFSVFEGEVKRILVLPGYNQCVLIKHGDYFTFYCKLDRVKVKAGDKVSTGQNIGKLAETSEGSEIHFQLWNGTDKQNPENWLSKR
jgi:septal ring factor EnvC (AmiA/AmiB activator)